jgi:hypothetical protein
MIVASTAAAVALVGTYLALGGSDYEPTPVQDPCDERAWRAPDGIEEAAEQFALSALDGAACDLQVSRETLALALRGEESREQFAAEYGIDDARLEEAVHAGLVRAVDDSEEAEALSPVIATPLRAFVSRVPVDEGIALIEDATVVFEDAESLFDQGQSLLEEAEDLLGELLP